MNGHGFRHRSRLALGVLGAGALAAVAPVAVAAATAQDLAHQVLNNPRITLARVHVSGVVDGADAHGNIVDTAQGRQARRSAYGTAPGGTVGLDTRMLQGMLNRAAAVSFGVSEIAGGSHTTRSSRHYSGVAFDANVLNGHRVSARGNDENAFMNGCRADGATEVLFEGTHVHCAW